MKIQMEATGSKPMTKIHKSGFTRNSISTHNLLEGSKCYVLGKRESTPEVDLDTSVPFRRESITLRTKSTDIMSYNLWKSRRSSLPNYLSTGQKKIPSCSGFSVPFVLTKEPKVLRKYSTSFGSTENPESKEQMNEVNPGKDAAKNDAVSTKIRVLPKEETWEQIFRRESSAITQGSRSYCDSVSTLRGSSISLRKSGGEHMAYYAKSDSIKRWLSELE